MAVTGFTKITPLPTISGASYLHTGTIPGSPYVPRGFWIKPDGTKLWFVTGDDKIIEKSFGTPWNSQTLSNVASVNLGSGNYFEIFIKDGTTFFIQNDTNDTIKEYRFNTEWTIADGITSIESASIPGGISLGIAFANYGQSLYTTASSVLYKHVMSTAWDISTKSQTQSLGIARTGVWVTNDEKRIFMMSDASTTKLYQYDFGTAGDISTLTQTDVLTVSGIYNGNFFHLDQAGGKLYFLNKSVDQIREYELAGLDTRNVGVFKV